MSQKKQTWKKQLAEKVRRARGIESQARFAAISGVSDTTISLIEHEKLRYPPRAKTLVRLASAAKEDPHEWLSMVGIDVRPEQINEGDDSLTSEPSDVAEEVKVMSFFLKERLTNVEEKVKLLIEDQVILGICFRDLLKVLAEIQLPENITQRLHELKKKSLESANRFYPTAEERREFWEFLQKARKEEEEFLEEPGKQIYQSTSDFLEEIDKLSKKEEQNTSDVRVEKK